MERCFLAGDIGVVGNWRRANVPCLNLIFFQYFEEVALLEETLNLKLGFLGGAKTVSRKVVYIRHPAFGHVHDCFCIFVDLIFGPIIHFLVGGL